MDSDTESNLKFWLPKIFPDRVRFIVTCDKDSESHRYLTDLGCTVLQMGIEPTLYDNMISSLYTRKTLCDQEFAEKCYKL